MIISLLHIIRHIYEPNALITTASVILTHSIHVWKLFMYIKYNGNITMDKKTSHLENNKHLSVNTHYSTIYRESLLQENQLLLYLPNLVPFIKCNGWITTICSKSFPSDWFSSSHIIIYRSLKYAACKIQTEFIVIHIHILQ